MILIDRLIDARDDESTCEVTIRPDSLFVEEGGVPAFVGIEYMAQAVAAHGGYQSYTQQQPLRLGLLLGTRRLVFTQPYFVIGQTLHIHVAHIWGKEMLHRFRCRIWDTVSNMALQTAELTVFYAKEVEQRIGGIGADV